MGFTLNTPNKDALVDALVGKQGLHNPDWVGGPPPEPEAAPAIDAEPQDKEG